MSEDNYGYLRRKRPVIYPEVRREYRAGPSAEPGNYQPPRRTREEIIASMQRSRDRAERAPTIRALQAKLGDLSLQQLTEINEFIDRMKGIEE